MLIITIIVILCFIMLYDDFYLDCGEAVFKLGLCIVFSFFISLNLGVLMPATRQDEAYEVKTLYAINDENNADSLYYLDTSDNCIRYMTMPNNYKDEKVISKLPIIERVTIVEGEFDEPYLEIYHGKFEHEWYWLFGIDIKSFLGSDDYYIFYIPKGSII